ncbi:MAG: hypothetical protein KF859_09655 [Phycisphaeraceae bacterium]|nr:hypothetical protein [Phycisphaeraceae bacterium]
MSAPAPFRTRDLGAMARLGITCLCLVLLGGFAASVSHLYIHDHKRDERPGLTIDDVKGVYHGVKSRSPLLVALEGGHPETIDAQERSALLDWLNGGRVNEQYDDFDKGDMAPAEIIARECVSCHNRASTDPSGIGQRMPLDSWDAVRVVAFSRDIQPNSLAIVVNSTHTHALAIGTLCLIIAGLGVGTRLPRPIINPLIALMGLGLLADIGGWWLTRMKADFAYMIVAGGAAFCLGSTLLLVLIIVDLWWPRKATGA